MTPYGTPYGENVDTVDQLSSITLLGIAVVGAVLTIGAFWLLGG